MERGKMKVKELIKELNKVDSENDVVIVSNKGQWYTTDIIVSFDDNNTVVIDEWSDSKAY